MVLKTKIKGNNRSKLSGRKKIMRMSLIISLLFHVSGLLAIQKAFPENWITSGPLRTYRIELLRPKVDPFLDDEEGEGTDLARIRPQEKEQLDKTGETISLNTKDKRYSIYAKIIKEKLAHHWKYPQEAWENLIEGKVLVLFMLNRQGRLMDIKIQQPSRFDILDREVERAIRDASPFPSFPDSITVQNLNIKANFTYRLTTRS